MRRRVRLALCCAAALSALGLPRESRGQAQTAPAARAAPWLRDRVGVNPLERALLGGDAPARERAIERLGTVGNARALELLVKALEPSGAAQSARERLLCIRMLARHVTEPKVRDALVRVMTGISVSAERNEPLHAWLRDSAALALAASGERPALEALGKALRQPGRVAQAAAAALVAHPPRDLGPVLAQLRTPTPELVWVLEALGDERAFEALRQIVRRGGPELSALAALALTRLGNFETVELARHWARKSRQPELRLTAAEILSLAAEPEAARLIATLLADPETRPRALELAARSSDPGLTATVLELLDVPDAPDAARLLGLLGRVGSDRAIDRLERLARAGAHADGAAYALALSPAPGATTALGRLLAEASTRRRAARAATLRRAVLGATFTPEGLERALEQLLASRDPRDRAVGAFGTALASEDTARELLGARDPIVVRAAARAAPFVGVARDAAWRLEQTPAGPTRSQLALALIDPSARALVPTRVLLDLIAEAGPAAPLALFALGARDSESTRPTLVEHLSSPDPELRAHAALGLGASEDPSALRLLEKAYAFEVQPSVRHAVVLGLGARPEAVRRRTLELAARLDPDAAVRHAAALALSGVRPSPFTPGVGTLWIVLGGPETPGHKAAKVRVPGGLSLPALADPEGVVALAGLPAGSIALRLARDGAGGNHRGSGEAR